jgi:predicted nuclease of restriction endonuclease-like (RecB) superfamily
MKVTPATPDYAAFLADVKARVLNARTSAARAVNRDLIRLYWNIGYGIVEKQRTAGWGDAVVERLAADLRAEFPDMRGFSTPNVWRMKQLYLDHSSPKFLSLAVRELKRLPKLENPDLLQQAVAEIEAPELLAEPVPEILSQAVRELVAAVPWGHHAKVLAKLTDPDARLYYLCATAQLGWSRSVLLNQIKVGAYERAVKEKKTHNFPLALPEHFAEQADEMMKSRYNLEFLGIGRATKERELEDRLLARLEQFLFSNSATAFASSAGNTASPSDERSISWTCSSTTDS